MHVLLARANAAAVAQGGGTFNNKKNNNINKSNATKYDRSFDEWVVQHQRADR